MTTSERSGVMSQTYPRQRCGSGAISYAVAGPDPEPMPARLALCLALLLAASAAAAQRTGDARYQVVINHEEQYSIWPADRDVPRGWEATGQTGTLAQAHAYIEEVWTDMRPLSLRTRMDDAGVARDEGRYSVVINHEEQYSLVAAGARAPRPWRLTGKPMSYAEAHRHIEEVWTDMRPLSVRGSSAAPGGVTRRPPR